MAWRPPAAWRRTPTTATARVLVLTTFDLDEYVFEALRVGASGFLLKAAMPDELRAAIRVVAGGEALLAPSATRRLIEEFTSRPATSTGPRVPDPRDHRARAGRAGRGRPGQSNSEIAAELRMSLSTVKTHVSHLLMKLDARDRTQLVVKAYEARFAIPGAQ